MLGAKQPRCLSGRLKFTLLAALGAYSCRVQEGETVPSYDACSWAARSELVVVETSTSVDSVLTDARTHIDRFTSTYADRRGPVVLKTSTADLRDPNHEPDIRLLESMLSSLRAAFPDHQLVLCDGPAFKANYVEIAKAHGWADLAASYGAEVIDLNELPAKPILDGSVSIASLCEEAAVTISVGKGKTHRRTGVSGAEKACIGYLSGAELGYPKIRERHYLLPAIYEVIQQRAAPTLHVIDGINAIQGDGPMNGTPLNGSEFLLIGEDPTLLDVVLARQLQFDPALVISLIGSLGREAQRQATAAALGTEPDGRAPTTLLTTERSVETLAKHPARPSKEQPWLYRSLAKQGSRRNRRNFKTIQKVYAEVTLDV